MASQIPGQPYFVDTKKGEVNELRMLLQNPAIDRDPAKKREVLKRVIAYMTLGIDVSRLFSQMIMATSTKDLVQKKIVYLYLCNYAEGNAELALLAINTLQKDCRDEDPMVRGLALRSLTSMRLPNLPEYAMVPIKSALADPSPYVRKTGVMAVLKIFHINRDSVKSTDLVDTLYNMIRDRDPSVVQNAVCALNEILFDEGQMAVNKGIVHHLLNRLRDFTEWGQCVVLESVGRYQPNDDEERFDIMNLLDERLKNANSAVVMSTCKVFLNLTRDMPQTHRQVYDRLRSPLLTLMGGGNVELAFSTLSHIKLLVERAPEVFRPEYKRFFCRYNDIPSVKGLKLDILSLLAVEENVADIVAELGEYATDVDASLARKAIQTIGDIGIKIRAGGEMIIEHLLRFLELEIDYVSAETVIVMKDLLRKYPERHAEVIPALGKCLRAIDEAPGKVAVIWMIGEYGEHIDDGPYILEPLIDSVEDETSSNVRKELLTATMKLFFKRPPECQKMLGRLLETLLNDVSHADVHDRALFYYRLLQESVSDAERVVNCKKPLIQEFPQDMSADIKEKIFTEFNTLAVIYGMPPERFLSKALLMGRKRRKSTAGDDDSDTESSSEDDNSDAGPTAPSGTAAAPPPSANLLDLDLSPAPAPAPAPAGIVLSQGAALTPDVFQKLWGSTSVGGTVEVALPAGMEPKMVEPLMKASSVYCLASGVVGDHIKLFMFGQEARSGAFVMAEVIVDQSSRQVVAKCKCEDPQLAAAFADLFRAVLSRQ